MILYFFYYLLMINAITFIVYGIDKWKAKHHRYRISERNLILLALIGGSIGALCGMVLFSHKTKKIKFFIGIPIILFLQIGLAIYLYMKY